MYYLQSRYYDPEVGRFLNADVVYDTDAGIQGYNLFLYCANDPINRIDISGADSTKNDDGDILDDELYCYGAGGGTGSMIGNISYISSKDTGPWNCISSLWEWLANKIFNTSSDNSNSANTTSTSTTAGTPNVTEVKHTKSERSPRNVSNPNGSHTQMSSNGEIYSYTEYDSYGRQRMRIDFQGKPHNGVLLHIHYYMYPPRGNVKKFVFDMKWHQIK